MIKPVKIQSDFVCLYHILQIKALSADYLCLLASSFFITFVSS